MPRMNEMLPLLIRLCKPSILDLCGLFTKAWVLVEACVGFLEIRCVRVFFNPCPSFPMVPVGTDLLECKQPWITVGSLFPLHKATEPWEQPFIQLVIIRIHNTVTATQLNRNPTPLQLSLREPINKTGNFCELFTTFSVSLGDCQPRALTSPVRLGVNTLLCKENWH